MGHLLNRSNREMNLRAVAHLDVRSGQRLLDVGFGGGVGIDAMLDIGRDLSITGIDFSDEMVTQQRARFGTQIAAGTVRLERGDVAALPFADASFARVLSSNTVYFWPDPVAALQEIHRVLEPGGRLVLGCATKESLDRFAPARHGFTIRSAQDVRVLLEEAGYVGIELSRPRGERAFFAIAHRSDED